MGDANGNGKSKIGWLLAGAIVGTAINLTMSGAALTLAGRMATNERVDERQNLKLEEVSETLMKLATQMDYVGRDVSEIKQTLKDQRR